MTPKKNRIKKNILGIVFILSVLSVGCNEKKQTSEAPKAKAVPVKLATLESATLINSSEYVGTLEAVQRVDLAPKINGRIMQIFVKEGDIVNLGQPIAELEPTQQKEEVSAASSAIQANIAQFNQSEAELRQREAERDGAKSEVSRLNASLTSALADLKRAESELQRTEAELQLATTNYQRAKFLVESGVQPQQDLDNKNRDLETSKANVQSQKKSRDAFAANVEASKQALNAAIQNLEAAQQRIEGSNSKVDQSKAIIEQSRGQKGSIEQELINTRINAPISGQVGDFKKKKIGDYLNTGEQFTTITNNQEFHLNINVPTEYLNRLRLGLPVENINPDGSTGVKGLITYIAPLIDQNSQSVVTKVTFINDGTLRDAQYVKVRIIWDVKPGVLIPTVAVSSLGGQKFVFLAAKSNSETGENGLIAKQQPIQVGAIQGQSYQVISGVKPGDKIAVTRILDLKDQTPITEAVESEE